MQKISPCLWFDTQAEEAAAFYLSIFPNSRINKVSRYGDGGRMPKGLAMVVAFTLDGVDFLALNGGPMFKFSEAVSFSIGCKTQAEVDHYWSKLTSGGGAESMCGWLKDKFGVSWQVVPEVLAEMAAGSDPERVRRMTEAMLKMRKLDIATLVGAYNG
ncbi:MAG TPA: VOC family protein [Rhizomicrobium sp.]|nr:VOC family protein [Rhizomicrobium sp.]